MLKPNALARLRARIRVRFNWFLAALLGPEVLSKEELIEVVELKALPDREVSLTERSFLLGRMKLLVKKTEWKDVDLDKLMRANRSLSASERLAIANARQQAATHIRGLESDLSEGVFTGIQVAEGKALNKATVQGVIQDEVALAVLYQKSYMDLAASMTKRLGTVLNPRWIKISRTELHRAKVAGSVQAILNKVGPFANLNGIDTKVSIVPNPDTCPDCARHYLDAKGNPKVYSLRELISAGTNADGSVSHSKKNGVHTHWKPTLPPLHPACACSVVPVPPGMEWQSGRLVAMDLKKAFGDPPAPKQPPSIPGIKSPGQKTPTAAPKPGDTPGDGGTDMVPCIFGGDERCARYGGKLGSKQHKRGSQADLEHQKAKAQGVAPSDPETAKQQSFQAKLAATAWDKEEHPHHVALDHLNNGVIATKDRLGEEQKGLQDTFKVAIAGNGSALYKPNQVYSEKAASGNALTEGNATIPHGTGASNEKIAYNVHMAFGLTDHVPPTATRMDQGVNVSMQSWQDGMHSSATYFSAKPNPQAKAGNSVDQMIQSTPPSKQDALVEKLSEGAVMAHVLNHQDQHMDNVMWDPEKHDVRFIDNTGIGGNGMMAPKNMIHANLHSLGRKLKVPDSLMDKMSKMSFGDIKRSTAGMKDWQQGQTFLRMQYVTHLQQTEGHLDYDKFRVHWAHPKGHEYPRAIDAFWHGKSPGADFNARTTNKTMPNDLFNGFAKKWIAEHASDPSSPHNADALELQKIGVFMPSTTEAMQNPDKFRAEGKHLGLEDKIFAESPEKLFPSGDARPDADLIQYAPTSGRDMSTRRGKRVKKGLFLRQDLLTGHKNGLG